MYLISPRLAHRFVGYLEEEACKTYTNLIKELDEGHLPIWKNTPAPKSAIKYWGLSKDATMREVIVSIRADEAMHREYNHHFADIPNNSRMERHKIYLADEIVNNTESSMKSVHDKPKDESRIWMDQAFIDYLLDSSSMLY